MSNKYKELQILSQKKRKLDKICNNKKQFETKEESFLQGQVSYQCKHCGKWHRSGKITNFLTMIKSRNKINYENSL